MQSPTFVNLPPTLAPQRSTFTVTPVAASPATLRPAAYTPRLPRRARPPSPILTACTPPPAPNPQSTHPSPSSSSSSSSPPSDGAAGRGGNVALTREEVGRLKMDYRMAKMVYKEAERRLKRQREADARQGVAPAAKTAPCPDCTCGAAEAAAAVTAETATSGVNGVTEGDVARLEDAYRAKKRLYKDAKRRLEGREERERMRAAKAVAAGGGGGCAEGGGGGGVEVCGGKTCVGMGAEVVAKVVYGRGGVPDGDCMKMCGGVGPSVRVGGVVRKVDVKGAVERVVGGGMDGERIAC